MKHIFGVMKSCLVMACLLVFCLTLLGSLPRLMFGSEAFIFVRHKIQNDSGEPVLITPIGWVPELEKKSKRWGPAPNELGKWSQIPMQPGQMVEIGLSNTDFTNLHVLVPGKTGNETRVVDKLDGTGLYRITRIPVLPLASSALIPCFTGFYVSIPNSK